MNPAALRRAAQAEARRLAAAQDLPAREDPSREKAPPAAAPAPAARPVADGEAQGTDAETEEAIEARMRETLVAGLDDLRRKPPPFERPLRPSRYAVSYGRMRVRRRRAAAAAFRPAGAAPPPPPPPPREAPPAAQAADAPAPRAAPSVPRAARPTPPAPPPASRPAPPPPAPSDAPEPSLRRVPGPRLLSVERVTGGYGDADVIFDLDLHVDAGEIVVIVGPNGAGKSTAMKAVFGLLRVRHGHIWFDGVPIAGWSPDRIVKRGICYVPQVDNVFREMSVHENLEMGAFIRRGDLSAAYDRVYALFPDLKAKRRVEAGRLSGGQRQMVAMGRALMLDPKLLLLDEPTAGLSPKYMERIFEIVRDVRETGVSILLVEQHAKQALAFADRGYVLAAGRNRREGTGAQLLADPEIARLFLGG